MSEAAGAAPDPPRPEADAPTYSTAYLRYALGLLTVIYVVNFVDRQILAILLEPIKQELGLSDAQLGIMTGTAFGIFYATLGVPIARLADIFPRKTVIAASLALWSGMTALCGTASGYATLLAYRIGVGVGEAGGSPPSHSIISDYFPPARRATALGVFSLGVPLGILVGFAAGGWLEESLGWRRAFLVVGLPGLALAVLAQLTLREPSRGHSEGHAAAAPGEAAPSARQVFETLWEARSFRHLAFASGLYAFVGYATVNWAPAFLVRSHQMSSGEIGTWLAMIFGLGGGVGVVLGGVAADRWAERDARGRAWVPMLAMFASLPFGPVVYTAESTAVALAFLTVPAFLGLMYQAPAFAVTQSLVAPAMRATAAAVLLFVVNIIGLALGPFAAGALSDALEPRYGVDSLARALLCVHFVLAWAGVHFWLASRHLVRDLEAAGAR